MVFLVFFKCVECRVQEKILFATLQGLEIKDEYDRFWELAKNSAPSVDEIGSGYHCLISFNFWPLLIFGEWLEGMSSALYSKVKHELHESYIRDGFDGKLLDMISRFLKKVAPPLKMLGLMIHINSFRFIKIAQREQRCWYFAASGVSLLLRWSQCAQLFYRQYFCSCRGRIRTGL